MARRRHNPISPLSRPPNSRSERKHAISSRQRAVFVYQHTQSNSPPLPLWASDWGVTESERHCELSFVLFQIHSRETLTKSISLPRSAYWQHITRQNSVGDLYSYQGTGMKLLIITHTRGCCHFFTCPWQRQKDRWRNREAEAEGKLHPYTWTCLSECIGIVF